MLQNDDKVQSAVVHSRVRGPTCGVVEAVVAFVALLLWIATSSIFTYEIVQICDAVSNCEKAYEEDDFYTRMMLSRSTLFWGCASSMHSRILSPIFVRCIRSHTIFVLLPHISHEDAAWVCSGITLVLAMVLFADRNGGGAATAEETVPIMQGADA